MGKKLSQKEFEDRVFDRYGDSIKVIGHYKSRKEYVLIEDKYGILNVQVENLMEKDAPTIKSAVNKTLYFMNKLKEAQPHIHDMVTPVSDYVTNETNMLFKIKHGIVSIRPSNLLSGKIPSLRAAIDRKKYRLSQFEEIHKDRYSYEFIAGTANDTLVRIVCQEHGKFDQVIDTHLRGSGCPKCKHLPSNILYFIKLVGNGDEFLKIGISRIDDNEPIRFDRYRALGYEIEILSIKVFDNEPDARSMETIVRRELKLFRYTPDIWEHKESFECFTLNLQGVIQKLIDE